MPGIMVPKSRAEAPAAASDDPLAQKDGMWVGTLEEVRARAFPDFIGKAIREGNNRGYSSPEGEILGLQFGELKNMEEEVDVGARKAFTDFVTKDGDAVIEDSNAIPDASWQMKKDAARLTNLALAIGATSEVEYNGEAYVETTPDFLDQLRDGDLIGTRVIFKTKAWVAKSGKKGYDVVEFFVAL